MKHRRKAILIALAAATGCSAAPEKPSDPLANKVEWQQANAEMERYFEETDLPDTLDVPPSALKYVVQHKADQYGDVRQTFRALYDSNDVTLRAAATLRVAQVDLNFACDLTTSAPPESLDEASSQAVEESLSELARPMLQRADENLRQAARMGDNEFAAVAQKLAAEMPASSAAAGVKEYCLANRNAWYRKQTMPFAARMKSRCELGIAGACYVAAELADDVDEKKRLATLSCEQGIAQACSIAVDATAGRPAQAFGVGGVGDFPSTCAEGATHECWRLAARVDPEELQTYTDYCFKGSGYDCLRRGLLLERSDALLDACKLGAIPEASKIDDARAGCDSGDAKACFQLGVATYIPPREVENSKPRGVLGTLRASAGGESTEDPGDKIAACTAGDDNACLRAAQLVPYESSDRVLYLDKACELGQAQGCLDWGRAVLGNENAPDSARKEAVTAIRSACHDGVQDACSQIAFILGEGKDLPKSKVCAARYLFESCTPDKPWACNFERILP